MTFKGPFQLKQFYDFIIFQGKKKKMKKRRKKTNPDLKLVFVPTVLNN